MLRPETFTRAKDWPSLASAHPKVGWGPPKNFDRENLKFGLKFSVLRSITSGLVRVSSWDFFSVDAPLGRGDNCVQFLQGPPPKNLWPRKKSSKIFSDFWQFSTLIANISGTDQHIKNRRSSWSSATPPTLGEKNLVYFGPQTKKLLSLINVHPNGLFSEDYIVTLRGCCALKFLQALKTDQALLAHTPRWDGSPPKNLIAKN